MKFLLFYFTFLIGLTFCLSAQSTDVIKNKDPINEQFIDLSDQGRSGIGSILSIFGLTGGDIETIISLTKVGLDLVKAVHQIFNENFNSTGKDFNVFDFPNGEKKLLNMFNVITHRLDQIQAGVQGTHETLRDLIRGLPQMVRWEIALNTLDEYTRGINNLFHRFSYYQNHEEVIEEHTLLDFAESVVSHDPHSTHALMANIHSLAAPSDPPIVVKTIKKDYEREEYDVYNRVNAELSNHLRRHFIGKGRGDLLNDREVRDTMSQISLRPSIFRMLLEALENYNDCSMKQTPQQLIYGLYTMLSVVQARGYLMSAFSYKLLKYYDEGNFTVEKTFQEDLYNHYSKGILKEAHKVLSEASNSFRKCDPIKHVEGKTFEMVTELLQGYVENEVDLNKDGTCRQNCGYYQHADVYGCYSSQSQFCGKERTCSGRVHKCRYFEADADICLSNSTQRRYDSISYEGGTFLGQRGGTCGRKLKVDSWWRFLVHCSYCVCLCDDIKSPTSDRFISLVPSMADTLDNKVVTGIRFVKKNRVIHIQIQEAKAIPQGQIDPESMSWKPVEPIDVKSSAFNEGTDYFTLRYEARNVDLDLLKAPKGHAVTGLRFRMLGPHVNLEMAVTPIDFASGKLNYKMTYWVSNDNTPARAKNPRKELHLSDPDDPRRSRRDSRVDSHSDMFVELQPTSMYRDVSQLTVPFFDAQPVSPMPPTWLEGVELYHRGQPKFGGFLAFKVFNYNLNRHFEQEILR